MSAKIINLPDARATKKLGQKLAALLPAGSVILLEGELGAGKTVLVQGIGEGLGIEEPIVSPTFTLVNEYLEGTLPLYHLDLYRLQPEDIESLYLETYWKAGENPPGITAIEWASRLPQKPACYLEIELIYGPEETRQARIENLGELEIDMSLLT